MGHLETRFILLSYFCKVNNCVQNNKRTHP